jgi:clan AA aspartic protease
VNGSVLTAVSTFFKDIEIGDLDGTRFETMQALVETAATYTSVPRSALERLGIEPREERPFILANGQRYNYGMGWVRIRLDGKEQPTLVIFGDSDARPLLGAFTLEGFGLAVDPVNQELTSVPGFLVGIIEDVANTDA